MLKNARIKAMIDAELAGAAHAYVAFSENGTQESSKVARIPRSLFGGWSTPAAAHPYQPGNTTAFETPTGASSGCTITHYATCASDVEGTDDYGTEWIACTDPDPILVTDGKLSGAIGALKPVSTSRG